DVAGREHVDVPARAEVDLAGVERAAAGVDLPGHGQVRVGVDRQRATAPVPLAAEIDLAGRPQRHTDAGQVHRAAIFVHQVGAGVDHAVDEDVALRRRDVDLAARARGRVAGDVDARDRVAEPANVHVAGQRHHDDYMVADRAQLRGTLIGRLDVHR